MLPDSNMLERGFFMFDCKGRKKKGNDGRWLSTGGVVSASYEEEGRTQDKINQRERGVDKNIFRGWWGSGLRSVGATVYGLGLGLGFF